MSNNFEPTIDPKNLSDRALILFLLHEVTALRGQVLVLDNILHGRVPGDSAAAQRLFDHCHKEVFAALAENLKLADMQRQDPASN
jgi:hypothetical protein